MKVKNNSQRNIRFSINYLLQHKKPAPTAQIRELLSILPRRGKQAYGSFIKALVESENTHASDFLQEKEDLKTKEQKPKNSSFSTNKNSEKPQDCSGVIHESTQKHSGKAETNKKLESPNIQDTCMTSMRRGFDLNLILFPCILLNCLEVI